MKPKQVLEIAAQLIRRNQEFYGKWHTPTRKQIGKRSSTAGGDFSEIQIKNVLSRLLGGSFRVVTGIIHDDELSGPQTDLFVVRRGAELTYSLDDFALAHKRDVLLAVEVKNWAGSGEKGVESDVKQVAQLAAVLDHPKPWIVWIDVRGSLDRANYALRCCQKEDVCGAVVGLRRRRRKDDAAPNVIPDPLSQERHVYELDPGRAFGEFLAAVRKIGDSGRRRP